ncbi:orotidine 5'-phosphate decarboxylase [Companilactobacillus alimentarius]|uniref:3-hexulose-6-phosphate synthase n=1 Tax=Companilactobacillus alimentarius DSM 20249 TaxID=1423720 RepID=A0A2K9HNX9_9LACO|nr:orotidine 5'-phosphate decarboxylase / HUMPS family protein [Companilactobacillus alimentarius]AUI72023.1 3-hexulose-6-phosphate synthase [Companilactobacillus alimentarius DSM 20249]MDT6952558.1 orotidine 5'-phosphate decarboxylase / HUMPS family protein [Companilactobacillus alimentarius]GEO44794.1 3-hexulose-6-phosphate synthase [Companilactobacillus alimentarius]
MKLQVAIDRVPLERALLMMRDLDSIVDVIELGTSIVKDYGLVRLRDEKIHLNHSKLLLDLKTNDEGKYEFEKGFSTGADILTVMASSSRETIEQVYDVAMKNQKQILIDLMETDEKKIEEISDFKDAIFCIHHSKDAGSGFDAATTTANFHKNHPEIEHIAVAGGIDLSQAKILASQNIADMVIVGSKISGQDDPVSAAKNFMEVIQ